MSWLQLPLTMHWGTQDGQDDEGGGPHGEGRGGGHQNRPEGEKQQTFDFSQEEKKICSSFHRLQWNFCLFVCLLLLLEQRGGLRHDVTRITPRSVRKLGPLRLHYDSRHLIYPSLPCRAGSNRGWIFASGRKLATCFMDQMRGVRSLEPVELLSVLEVLSGRVG